MRAYGPVPWEEEAEPAASGRNTSVKAVVPEPFSTASEPGTLQDQCGLMAQKTGILGAEENREQTLSTAAPPFSLPSLRSRVLRWRTILPLVVVVVVLALVAEQLRLALDPSSIAAVIVHSNGWLFLAAFVAFYASLLLRVLRWRLLLENVGYRKEQGVHLPNFFHLTNILYLSWFANLLVSAKLGDLYRVYLLRKVADVSVSRSFGTVLAERILELVALLLLFLSAILIGFHGQLPAQLDLAVQAGLVLVGGVMLGLVVLRLSREQIGRLVPARFRAQYVQFQAGTLGSFRQLPLLTFLSVVAWIVESLRFLFVALAVGLLSGDPLHIGAAALLIALGESVLTTVPLTSGGVGFVEAGMFAMILLFTPQAAAHNTAGAAILLDRLISLVSILVFGGILFCGVTLRGKRQRQAERPGGMGSKLRSPESEALR